MQNQKQLPSMQNSRAGKSARSEQDFLPKKLSPEVLFCKLVSGQLTEIAR
jgi:hypothetical protein